jgi:hypothetical protein
MQKIIFALVLVLTAPAWGKTCDVAVPPHSDRLEKIEFPDGREIYMLGYIHGDRELPFKMAELVKTRAPQMTDQAIQSEIATLAGEAVFAADEEKVDVGQLEGLLKSHPELAFVGFETEDQFAIPNLENYQLMLTAFHSMVQKRGPASLPEEAVLERVVLGAAGTLRLSQPALMSSRQIRGFESANGTNASAAATVAAEEALDQVKALAKGDASFIRNINGTGMQLDEMYATYSPEMDAGFLQQMQNAPMPEAYRNATVTWLRLKLAEMAADKRREHDVVENLLAANSSGILIMGSAHMDGIMTELQKRCLSPLTSEASM